MHEKSLRRRLRFSVRTLLIAVTLASVLLGLRVKHVRELDAAVAKLERAGFAVYTEIPSKEPFFGKPYFRPKSFLRRLITREGGLQWLILLNVHTNNFSIDDGVMRNLMPAIKKLPHVPVLKLSSTSVGGETLREISSIPYLESLCLRNTEVTDDDIQQLASASQLKELDLRNTRVTMPGVNRLKRKLPNCSFEIEETAIRFPLEP